MRCVANMYHAAVNVLNQACFLFIFSIWKQNFNIERLFKFSMFQVWWEVVFLYQTYEMIHRIWHLNLTTKSVAPCFFTSFKILSCHCVENRIFPAYMFNDRRDFLPTKFTWRRVIEPWTYVTWKLFFDTLSLINMQMRGKTELSSTVATTKGLERQTCEHDY